MAVIRWYDPQYSRPGHVVDRLQREMNRLFSNAAGGAQPSLGVSVFPAVNVSEDQENVYLRAELPGMKPDEIEISVEGETVTLRGERKTGNAAANVNYHRRERESGRFRRIVGLPVKIDPDAVSATFKNGVLKVILPKAKEAMPKQIKVKTE